MTVKADFNAEEWALLAEAPALAGLVVISAERGGTLREMTAMNRFYVEARQQAAGELLQAILATPPAVQRPQVTSPDELRAYAADRLRAAVAVLEQKATTEETGAYRTFALELAEQVATSHKEGGFLGFGGTEISAREQEVLTELADVLGLAL